MYQLGKSMLYTVKHDGFQFDFVAGKIVKNSKISKKSHPLEEVENYKKKLIANGNLSDRGSYFTTNNEIYTGFTMAWNLYCGELKHQYDGGKCVYIDRNDIELKTELAIQSIFTHESRLQKIFHKDCLKISEIFSYEYNMKFFVGNNANDFSKSEKYVCKLLEKVGNVSCNVRHGDALKNEMDIVDEQNKNQIEVVSLFKNDFKSYEGCNKPFELILIESINNPLIHLSEAFKNKFYKKTYTSEYKKNLAVLSFGRTDSMQTVLDRIVSMLDEFGQPRNEFYNIFLIFYDFLESKLYFLDFKKGLITFDDSSLFPDIINLKKVDQSETTLNKEKPFLYIIKNIFTEENVCGAFNYEGIKPFVEKFKII